MHKNIELQNFKLNYQSFFWGQIVGIAFSFLRSNSNSTTITTTTTNRDKQTTESHSSDFE